MAAFPVYTSTSDLPERRAVCDGGFPRLYQHLRSCREASRLWWLLSPFIPTPSILPRGEPLVMVAFPVYTNTSDLAERLAAGYGYFPRLPVNRDQDLANNGHLSATNNGHLSAANNGHLSVHVTIADRKTLISVKEWTCSAEILTWTDDKLSRQTSSCKIIFTYYLQSDPPHEKWRYCYVLTDRFENLKFDWSAFTEIKLPQNNFQQKEMKISDILFSLVYIPASVSHPARD